MTHQDFTISVDPQVIEIDVEEHIFEIALNQRGPAGADGEDGADGAPGVDGQDGSDGAPGADGTNGTDGATWRTGSGAPSDSLGVDGDLYFRTDTSDVHLRSAGTYTIIANIEGSQGDPGSNGTNGTNGSDGAPGSVWRDGSGAPSNGLGIDGDYYLDNPTGNVYVKASGTYSIVSNIVGPQGNPGSNGADGTNGAPGSVWRDGSGAPSNGLGVDGDYYLDADTSDVYLKSAGTYSPVANIRGSQGVSGADGVDGSLFGLLPTAIKTSNYTADFGEMVLVDLSGGSFNVTLPAAVAGPTSIDNRKRVGVKFVGTSTSNPNLLQIFPTGVSLEAGGDAFYSPAIGTYVEYHYDSTGQGNNGEWRRVSVVNFPLQQQSGSAVSASITALPGNIYRIEQNFNSDITIALPTGIKGDRVGVKLQANNNQKIVTIDASGIGGYIDPNPSGTVPQTLVLTRSYDYLELESLGNGVWTVVRRDVDGLYRDANNIGSNSIRSADFTAVRNTSHRFYTSVGSTRTITMPDSGTGSLYFGDRVELIAIGHGNDRVSIDGNSNNIEFSRSQKSTSATFNSNGFYMLLEWVKSDGSFSGSGDCWTVIESSVGAPGSRHKMVTATNDMTAEINTTVLVDVSSNPVTITLPSHAEGDRLIIKNGASTANTLTVNGNGSNIDGSASITLTLPYEWSVLESTGSEWAQVG